MQKAVIPLEGSQNGELALHPAADHALQTEQYGASLSPSTFPGHKCAYPFMHILSQNPCSCIVTCPLTAT